MSNGAGITALGAMLLLASLAALPQTATPQGAASPASALPTVELDHVVANIGSNVILQSDVEQEMRLSALEPLQVLPGQNTPDSALRRLIDRTLILEELRRQIPACAKFHCETAPGWDAFLKSHGLTPEMVEQRWSQRMAMLHFIDLRFRSGIRISPEQIAAYDQKTLVPALEKNHEKAPPLADVSARIQEILLQQQVSGLFQDWLSSLRDQGDVRIVDPAYSADLNLASHSNPSP
jgi:hypothetical protein